MRRVLAIFAATALLLTPAFAKHKPGKGKGHGREEIVVFAPADRTVITGYYRSSGGLPPGLAKRNGDLPPGLEKQLRRNGRLPPGLEKKLVPFPVAIESRLPPCPPDVHRGMLGGVAVMYSSRTGLVIDAVVVAGR
jgi:hypothetical protein